jgi:hypothetical protein
MSVVCRLVRVLVGGKDGWIGGGEGNICVHYQNIVVTLIYREIS